MANVLLIVHLIVAVFLIAVVLLQRSEGGALGMGGGGGGGLVSSRGAATALSKVTWALAIGFLCTSLALTWLANGGNQSESVFDTPSPSLDGGEIPLPTLPPLPGAGDDVPLPGIPQPSSDQ